MTLLRVLAGSVWSTGLTVLLLFALAVLGGTLFRVTPAGSVALYFVLWWLVLFVILPLRLAMPVVADEAVVGADPGAPSSPAMRERVILTTLLSTIVFVIIVAMFPLAGL